MRTVRRVMEIWTDLLFRNLSRYPTDFSCKQGAAWILWIKQHKSVIFSHVISSDLGIKKRTKIVMHKRKRVILKEIDVYNVFRIRGMKNYKYLWKDYSSVVRKQEQRISKYESRNKHKNRKKNNQPFQEMNCRGNMFIKSISKTINWITPSTEAIIQNSRKSEMDSIWWQGWETTSHLII